MIKVMTGQIMKLSQFWRILTLRFLLTVESERERELIPILT